MTAMPVYAPQKITFEEFLDWLDEDTRAEWVDGEIELMSPASFAHQDLIAFLVAVLRYFAEVRQLGVVITQPFVMKTGPDLPGREPDILFIATANIPRIQRNFLNGPADLVIEIVSPESQTRDRHTKLEEYRQGSVREYWTLDPTRQEALFRQLQPDGTYQMITPDDADVYHSAVMSGVWINVGWLWQTPLPTIASVLKQWKLI